jgi:hypothetical protein
MASQDVIDWLKAKRDTVKSPAEIAQFKTDLRAQISTLSLNVANQKTNAITFF